MEKNRAGRIARNLVQSVVETVPLRVPLRVVLDEKMRVQIANPSFYKAFHVSPPQTEHR